MIKVHKWKLVKVIRLSKVYEFEISITLTVSGSIWPKVFVHGGCHVLPYVNVWLESNTSKNKNRLRVLCYFFLHKLYVCTSSRKVVQHCDISLQNFSYRNREHCLIYVLRSKYTRVVSTMRLPIHHWRTTPNERWCRFNVPVDT